jgi:hypothetical protein
MLTTLRLQQLAGGPEIATHIYALPADLPPDCFAVDRLAGQPPLRPTNPLAHLREEEVAPGLVLLRVLGASAPPVVHAIASAHDVKRMLDKRGMDIRPSLGDGQCFYESAAASMLDWGLRNDKGLSLKQMTSKIREAVRVELAAHRERYDNAMPRERKDGWAEAQDVQATANVFKVNVVVYRAGVPMDFVEQVVPPEEPDPANADLAIRVYYNGTNHFDGVLTRHRGEGLDN